MSVDVFGRKLGRTKATRGPPGIGYRLTDDGQYDAESKRLCNLAVPQLPNDAVNLVTAQRINFDVQMEIDGIDTRLRNDLHNLNVKIDHGKDVVDTEIMKITNEMKTMKDNVNLDIILEIVKTEVQSVTDIITRIRTNLDVLDKIVETHRDEIDVELAKLKVEMKGIKDALRL